MIILGDEGPSSIKQEILDKIAALVTAAFGLVAALAWNDAIKLLLELSSVSWKLGSIKF